MEDEYKMLTVKISEQLHRDLKVCASIKGLKLKELVTEIFEEQLKRENRRT